MCIEAECPYLRSIGVERDWFEGNIRMAKHCLPQEVEAMASMIVGSLNHGSPEHF